MHYFSCVNEILRVSIYIGHGYKVFSDESSNSFTILKLDLLSTADDMKQEIDVYLHLYVRYTPTERVMPLSDCRGKNVLNSYGLPRGSDINLGST